MQAALALTLILVGTAFMWVSIHGYESAEPSFKGYVEGLYRGLINAANE